MKIEFFDVKKIMPDMFAECLLIIEWYDGKQKLATGYWNGEKWILHEDYMNLNVLFWAYEYPLLEWEDE